ncbi:MAG TPA: hypothetical protein QF720_07110 [Nitrospinota bacterium]|nr:hypothetical protein [Nitrospinota bacterium]|tara:strand:- start:122041 stop:122472 length:432 start_codon:yes stop_codon:yes gene_type:complete
MDVDGIINTIKRLQPPDSLQKNVVKAVATTPQEYKPEEVQPTIIDYIWQVIIARKIFLPLTAAALIAMVYVNLNVTTVIRQGNEQLEAVMTTNTEKFIRETIDTVFNYNLDNNVQLSHEEEEVNDFVSSNLMEIYWINGGKNA